MCSKNNQMFGRGERIRTSGPCLPKTVLYQAELLPDRSANRVAQGHPDARQARPIGSGSGRGKRGKRLRREKVGRGCGRVPQKSDPAGLGPGPQAG